MREVAKDRTTVRCIGRVCVRLRVHERAVTGRLHCVRALLHHGSTTATLRRKRRCDGDQPRAPRGSINHGGSKRTTRRRRRRNLPRRLFIRERSAYLIVL